MRKRYIAGMVMAGAVLWPNVVQAQATSDLTLDVMPKECTYETISDGNTQLNYLSPADCQELLHPTPKPSKVTNSAGQTRAQAQNQPNGADNPQPQATQGRVLGDRESRNGSGTVPPAVSRTAITSKLDDIARWVTGTKTAFTAAAPYAMAGVLAITALVAADAMLNRLLYTRFVVRRVRRPVATVKKIVRRT